MKIRLRKLWLPAIPVFLGLAVLVYQFPPVHERLTWRIDSLRARVKYAIHPPEEEVFVPIGAQSQVDEIVQKTLQALTPTPTPTPPPTSRPAVESTPDPDNPPSPLPSTTPTATPLPTLAALSGFQHEYQKWNNCGPANLSMSLSYWGWDGHQGVTASYLKPNPRDKNVMPHEMVAFVEEETDLKALTRMGGTLELMKRLIAGGFPVIAETGFEDTRPNQDFEGWMGHYEVVNAYDDEEGKFYLQDSYLGPRVSSTYEDMKKRWRAFNYTFIITYPAEKEDKVFELLGPYQDPEYGKQQAAGTASSEIFQLTGRAKFFAWFNRGSSLVAQDDYYGAAAAYDEAFTLYAQLAEEERPWRMMWYQTGPYWAYYYTGRYYDVINLATQTIDAVSEPTIEESWFWRAMAKEQLGDTSGAISDLRKALDLNKNYEIAEFHLNRIQNQ